MPRKERGEMDGGHGLTTCSKMLIRSFDSRLRHVRVI